MINHTAKIFMGPLSNIQISETPCFSQYRSFRCYLYISYDVLMVFNLLVLEICCFPACPPLACPSQGVTLERLLLYKWSSLCPNLYKRGGRKTASR